MSMTSREIIDRAIHFRGPQRVGMTLPKPYPHDIAVCSPDAAPGFDARRRTEGTAEFWVDEWGCTWSRLGGISKGEVVVGAITDWDQLDAYRAPDFSDPRRYERARTIVAANPDRYQICGLPGGWFFAAARYIRKMENYLCDLLVEPERVRRLNQIVIAANEQVIHQAGRLGVQAIMAYEDWGTQVQPLISPQMFRELFKPGIRHLCDLAKGYGMARFMHSCGGMGKLIPDLMDAGVQVFQFDAPESAHGIDHLNAAYGGRAAFWCPVDIQTTLQTRDPVKIRREARDLCQKLGGHKGGFIAGYYGDNVAIGLDPAVQDIACRAFVEFAAVE